VSKCLNKVHARHVEAAKADVLRALRLYVGLVPDIQTFVYDNGDERRLMTLSGTIPVEYQSNSYNIPVCLWIRNDHPTSAPMVYVTPTSDMRIKASRFVQQDGKVRLPYIDTDWKYPDSTLTGLVQVCCSAFGEIPPVFSKSRKRSKGSKSDKDPVQRQNSTESSSSLSNMAGDASQSSRRSSSVAGVAAADSGVTDEELRSCLLSEVEDTLRLKLEEEESKTKAELESLSLVNHELLDNQEEMERVEGELETMIAESKIECDELTSCLETMEKLSQAFDGITLTEDSVRVGGGPLHKQIMELYADDLAYSDALYWLGEGFKAGHVPCEKYLKKVRDLSRKQFYTRFLLEKCRHKAGIGDEVE